MNCIIIEDIADAVQLLESQLELSGHPVNIQARIDSVENAVSWLQNNQTDLIFLDIELGDGLGFDIFDHVQIKTPVIFTTSYDEYIERAFTINSISYLLKPIMPDKLKQVLDKYHFLYENDNILNEKIISLQQHALQKFWVRNGNDLKCISAGEVAWFNVQNKHYLFLTAKDGKQYLYDSTLEILEQRLDPNQFFRINRQYIVNFDVVTSMHGYNDKRGLIIGTTPVCKEEIAVSRHRVNEFKSWINK